MPLLPANDLLMTPFGNSWTWFLSITLMIFWYTLKTWKSTISKFNKSLTSFWMLDYMLNLNNANLTKLKLPYLTLLSPLMVSKWIPKRSLMSKTMKRLPVSETSNASFALPTSTDALLKGITGSASLCSTCWKKTTLFTCHFSFKKYSMNLKRYFVLPQSWSTLTLPLKPY